LDIITTNYQPGLIEGILHRTLPAFTNSACSIQTKYKLLLHTVKIFDLENIYMKKSVILFFFLIIVKTSIAQLSVGASFGTYSVPGATYDLKGFAPTLRIEYTGGEETQQIFLDATLFTKNFPAGSTDIYDGNGSYLGYALTKQFYSIKHLQLGFKRSLAGDFTDSKFNCFLGAGVAACFVGTKYKYSLTGQLIPDEKINRNIFGFHFNTGGQWRIKKIVLELKGNFDIVLKPVEVRGGDNASYIITSLRAGIMIPIVKY
jgi:hypothetical protein